MISKQYYYMPSVPHQIYKSRFAHSDFKMIYNKIRVSGKAGDSIGSAVVSNGIGHPLLMGPLIFPVVPVGGLFQKNDSRFMLELTVNCNYGYFMPLAIDSAENKRIRDSLILRKFGTRRTLNNTQCYMIVNDTLKVPLMVKEFFMGSKTGHSYALNSDIKFRKVKTFKLITGNTILDSTLRNVTFTRKSRIKYDLIGPGY